MIESHLLTEKSGKELARANNYLRRWIAYPDKGSDFDKKQGCLKYILRIPLISQAAVPLAIKWLKNKGYDGLFLENNQDIIGHNAFQVHPDNSLHVFSIYISPNYRRQGLALQSCVSVADNAFEKGIEKIVVSKGNRSDIQGLLKRMQEFPRFSVSGNIITPLDYQ